MSARTLAEWQAYAAVEPFGPPAAWWRAGLLAATLANVHRDPKRKRTPYRVEEFLPELMRHDEPESEDALTARWRLYKESIGDGASHS